MKKSFVLPLIMLSLLFSCATTEEVPHPVFEDPVVETSNVDVSVPEAEVVIDEPLINKPAPEKKEEVPKVEKPVVEKAPEPETQSKVVTESEPVKKDTVLTGKALVEVIREDEKNKKASLSSVDATETLNEVPQVLPADENIEAPAAVESPVVEEEAVVEENESEDIPDAPVVEKSVSTVTETPVNEEASVLDQKLDSKVLSVSVELISILVIFALSSVIRNKYSRPLSIGLSFLLAILFTAIPMLIAFILFGWSNIHLLYIVLIFTVFIFASRRGH